jgi:hypothetical protein
MTMKRSIFTLSAIFLCAGIRASRAQDCAPVAHRDIDFKVQSNKIVTGVAILDCPIGTPPEDCMATEDFGWRVHPRPYQQDQCDPFFVDDPGTFAEAGSGLPAGSFVGFNIMADLLYWNGLGTPQFGPVPQGETLKIRLGGQSRTAGTGTGFISGFNFAVVDSQGGIHVHLSFFLQGSDGNSAPAQDVPACGITGDGIQPTDGLYLLQLQFKSNAGITSSDPVWIVFNNGVPGCMNCVGINYVGSQIAHDRPRTDLDFDRHVTTSDLDRFGACATRQGVPWTDPCCQYADFDHDGDIDMDDFAIFQRCYSGPSSTADPNCAP